MQIIVGLAVLLLILMIVFTVLLAHSIEVVASKTGSAIGTALLACATSLPLWVFAIMFALEGETTIAMINIVGTNIADITVVLGILALIKPLTIENNFKKGAFALIVIILTVALAIFSVTLFPTFNFSTHESNGSFSFNFSEGIIIFVLFAVFIFILQLISRNSGNSLSHNKSLLAGISMSVIWGTLVCYVAAQAVLVIIHIARYYHMPEIIIGTVIVVIGTAFPEFAIGVVSIAMKKDKDVYGNMITSVVVNLCLSLGIILMFTAILVEKFIIAYHLPFMLIAIAASVILMHPKYQHLTRIHAIVLIGIYVLYLIGIAMTFSFF